MLIFSLPIEIKNLLKFSSKGVCFKSFINFILLSIASILSEYLLILVSSSSCSSATSNSETSPSFIPFSVLSYFYWSCNLSLS
jgi:hypothetical protein